ncbi:MAG: hypothetical protein ABH836_00160 [Candidatus Omnitrophota bacterium]
MGLKYNCIILMVLVLIAIYRSFLAFAEEKKSFVDEFNSPKLNSVWNIKARNGGCFINDWRSGRLMLISSRVEEGVYLNYNREINERDKVTFEAKLDTSDLTDDINIGFADQIMTPADSGELAKHILWGVAIVRGGWWTRVEDGFKEGKFQKGWHVFSLKIDTSFIELCIDGVYVGRKKSPPKPLYFYINGDGTTNYYTAKTAIDYIRVNYED